MNSRLTGLIAAPFTSFNPDGSLNLPMIDRQARSLVENGVSGAFICGTTGEGMSLTTEERLQICERWVAVAPPSLRVIVHVGHQSIGDSRKLSAHAERMNAFAFATIGPTFFKATTVGQLVDYCAEVAKGAPTLPFYFYHMPSMTGVQLSMHEFLKQASRRIPNLAGIKFTHEDLMDYSRCVQFENGRYNILFGRDEILLSALTLGATGAVGSTYNYMASVYHSIMEAFRAGDLKTANAYQTKAMEIIAVMSRRGGLPAAKAMMKLIGVDCGPVRTPLQNLSSAELLVFIEELKAVGFPVSNPDHHARGVVPAGSAT